MGAFYVGSHFRHEKAVALVAFMNADAPLGTGQARQYAGQKQALNIEHNIKVPWL